MRIFWIIVIARRIRADVFFYCTTELAKHILFVDNSKAIALPVITYLRQQGTIDETGIVQTYNKAAERIFGCRATEAIGANVKMLMPQPSSEEHDGYLARYLRERTPHAIGIGCKVRGAAQERRDLLDATRGHRGVTQ